MFIDNIKSGPVWAAPLNLQCLKWLTHTSDEQTTLGTHIYNYHTGIVVGGSQLWPMIMIKLLCTSARLAASLSLSEPMMDGVGPTKLQEAYEGANIAAYKQVITY